MPTGSEPNAGITSVARFFDPHQRAQRQRRRTKRKIVRRGLATIALAYLTSRVGAVPGVELGEVFWGAATVVSGGATIGAVTALGRPARPPKQVEAPPVPPPVTSAAHGPLHRLAAREAALTDLCGLLGPVCGDTVAEARVAAAALRRLAAQIVVLEGTRPGVPAEARPGLDAALCALQVRLTEGVSAYDLLVAAATDAVAASADGRHDDPGTVRRLHDATDSLAGLARGLREVPIRPG